MLCSFRGWSCFADAIVIGWQGLLLAQGTTDESRPFFVHNRRLGDNELFDSIVWWELEHTVKRHILYWIKKTSCRACRRLSTTNLTKDNYNYRTIFHTTCLPHSHDCPIIVNKNQRTEGTTQMKNSFVISQHDRRQQMNSQSRNCVMLPILHIPHAFLISRSIYLFYSTESPAFVIP
jgi:hypothetical protein